MPTEPSTQQTAQAVAPDARVAYVDNDPVVVNHLTALLHADPAAAIFDVDVNDAEAALGKVAGLIDRSRPVCLLMGALLHFYEPGAARDLVARYTAALAPGSYAVLTVFAIAGPNKDRLVELYSTGAHAVHVHSEAEFASFFGDLELLPPGVADARTWQPGWKTRPPTGAAREAWAYGGMARKNG
jgi:O-methyltransferase involved in polyketide biosynthesis